MKRLLIMIQWSIDQFNRGIGWLLAALLFVMTVLVFWQVFARFVIGNPLYFSDEIARFSMIWLTFVGAGYAYRKGLLISVDIALEFAGLRLSCLLRVVIILASAMFACILAKYGFDLMVRVANQTAPSTRISMMWPYLAVPVGSVIIVINSLALLIDEVIGRGDDKSDTRV